MWELVRKAHIWEKNVKENLRNEHDNKKSEKIKGNIVINLADQRKSYCQFSWHVQSHYAPHETGSNIFSKCYWNYALDCHFSTSLQLYSTAFMLWKHQRMRKKNEITLLKHRYDLSAHSPASFPDMVAISKTNTTLHAGTKLIWHWR